MEKIPILQAYCGQKSMVEKQDFYVYHRKTIYIKPKNRLFSIDIKLELSTLSTGFSTSKILAIPRVFAFGVEKISTT